MTYTVVVCSVWQLNKIGIYRGFHLHPYFMSIPYDTLIIHRSGDTLPWMGGCDNSINYDS